MQITGIDPGTTESAYATFDTDTRKFVDFEILTNDHMLAYMKSFGADKDRIITIERVVSQGMPIGETTIKTIFWSGRFYEGIQFHVEWELSRNMIASIFGVRKSDKSFITKLVDIFDPERKFGKYGKGKKKKQGPFFGFKDDIWQAAALAYARYVFFLEGSVPDYYGWQARSVDLPRL
jgi:hypothetical protein